MNKTVYAILTILFNEYGVPSFINGNVKKGVFTIISAIITLGIIGIINFVKGIIAGINILKMTDEEFEAADKATLTDAIVLFYKD